MKRGILSITTILILLLSSCSPPVNDSDDTIEQKEDIAETIIIPSKDPIQPSPNNTPQPKNSWYQPKPGISWQWQLSGEINTNYKVDLYDLDLVETPQEVIDLLHSRDSKIICYFSAGSWEKYRDDASAFPTEVVGNTLEGWPDEKWLDISNYESFAEIMQKRLDLAQQKECDGVEPDNVDGYANDNGFDVTYEDQLEYNKWLADEAHQRNLSIGLKNDGDQIPDLVDYFDFAINEQCFQYEECENLLPFIEQNKAVLGVEYDINTKEFCAEASSLNFSWLKMEYELAGERISCR